MLPSLSRLMKDGIGEGYTRADHQAVANQLFSCYAKVGDARALASVIGEDELSPLDKKYLVFGREFEHRFVGQDPHDNRNIITTLDIGWQLLGLLPKEELDRIDTKILAQYYKATKLDENGDAGGCRVRRDPYESEYISRQRETLFWRRTPLRWPVRAMS